MNYKYHCKLPDGFPSDAWTTLLEVDSFLNTQISVRTYISWIGTSLPSDSGSVEGMVSGTNWVFCSTVFGQGSETSSNGVYGCTSNTRHQYDAAPLPKADRQSLSVRERQ